MCGGCELTRGIHGTKKFRRRRRSTVSGRKDSKTLKDNQKIVGKDSGEILLYLLQPVHEIPSEASLDGLIPWVAQLFGDILPRFEPLILFEHLRELGATTFKRFTN